MISDHKYLEGMEMNERRELFNLTLWVLEEKALS